MADFLFASGRVIKDATGVKHHWVFLELLPDLLLVELFCLPSVAVERVFGCLVVFESAS